MNSPVRYLHLFFGFLFLLSSVLSPTLSVSEPSFRKAVGDYTLSYPRDHGAHPEYATEWWYFTGHLKDDSSNTLGFQLTFFRVGIQPERPTGSAWGVDSVYLAHFAITDDRTKSFRHFEDQSRGAFGEAGASQEGLSVWLKDWRAEMIGGEIILKAKSGGNSLSLVLKSSKPLTLHGQSGLSIKGERNGDASYYSSFTRLTGKGEIQLAGESIRAVSASVWMDQEFTSSSLSRETLGWDWFALQLSDGSELMLYQLRDTAGKPTKFSAGTLIHPTGETTHLSSSDFTISTLSSWTSPRSGVSYPSKWQLQVPQYKLGFTVTPTVQDQELITDSSTGVTYWEGRAEVSSVEGSPLGDAYVELVGYQRGETPTVAKK